MKVRMSSFKTKYKRKVYTPTGTNLRSQEGTKFLEFYKVSSPSDDYINVPMCATTF